MWEPTGMKHSQALPLHAQRQCDYRGTGDSNQIRGVSCNPVDKVHFFVVFGTKVWNKDWF